MLTVSIGETVFNWSGPHRRSASPWLALMISISVIAPAFTLSRSRCMVLLPSAFWTTTCVPVSPRRMFTMSKRQITLSAEAQKVSASFFSRAFSVMRALLACGSPAGLLATSAV